MKHVIIYISMALIAFVMVWLVRTNEEVVPIKVYTVDTMYSYIIDNDETIDLNFYINDIHPLTDINSYLDFSIENEDCSKLIEVEPLGIKSIGNETYLGESYNKYQIEIKMPIINQSFTIDDAYIHIELEGDLVYRFYIGSLSLYQPNEMVKAFDWYSLSAVKASNNQISRFSKIFIEYTQIDKTISYIELAKDYRVDYTLDEEILTLDIKDENRLYYATPVIIHYVTGEEEIINYFLYINDFQILKESGVLLHVYMLS